MASAKLKDDYEVCACKIARAPAVRRLKLMASRVNRGDGGDGTLRTMYHHPRPPGSC